MSLDGEGWEAKTRGREDQGGNDSETGKRARDRARPKGKMSRRGGGASKSCCRTAIGNANFRGDMQVRGRDRDEDVAAPGKLDRDR